MRVSIRVEPKHAVIKEEEEKGKDMEMRKAQVLRSKRKESFVFVLSPLKRAARS